MNRDKIEEMYEDKEVKEKGKQKKSKMNIFYDC